MDNEDQAVVLHITSGTSVAGFAGDEKPAYTFSNAENTDPEAAEQLWRDTIQQNLGVSTTTQPVMVTAEPGQNKAGREQTIKIFFEQLGVPAFYLANPGVLSVYATNRLTGLAVIAEGESTSIIPVVEGYAVKAAARNISATDNVSEAVQDSISSCDLKVRRELYKNIVLAGGSADLSSIGDSLKTELPELAPAHQTIKVATPEDPQDLAWVGGSRLASQSNFRQQWITRAEYDERGAGIVHQKCS